MRKGSKRLLRTGILAGVAYAGWRMWKQRVPASDSDISWETAPFPFPPIPRPAKPAAEPPAPEATAPEPSASASASASTNVAPFVEPASDGTCPDTHPVKAKLTSGIYHVPGGGNYDRTKPDRCYVDTEAAEADGLRAAKR